MQKYTQQTEKKEVKKYINTVVRKHLETNPENVGEIEHIIDYFNAKKVLNNLEAVPYKTAVEKSKKWILKLNQEACKVYETEEDIKTVKDFGDGFKFVQLVGQDAYKREGKLMSHCVASYYGKNDVKIYSLRDANNNPHCTLEVLNNGDDINQIKGKGNGCIHPKYIKYILNMLEALGNKVRESELSYLGYEKLDTEFMAFLEEHFKNVKYIMFNNKKFFYTNVKLVRRLPPLPQV